MGWRRQMFNPEYDWIFRTKPQEKVKNGGATPSPIPDPSFYWSRYAPSVVLAPGFSSLAESVSLAAGGRDLVVVRA